MANSKPVRTPLGTFPSAAQAARAHHCDRSTILNRINTDPENYAVVQRGQRTPVIRQAINPSWTQYRMMSHDERDQWYLSWCSDAGLDPDLDTSGDAFFDSFEADPEEAEDAEA